GHAGSAGSWRMIRRKRTYAAGASESGAPGCPEFAACTASIASVRIVSTQSRSSSVYGSTRSGTDRRPRVAPRHLLEREHLVVARVPGGAELRQPLDDDLLLRLAGGLEERARVELGRARLQRLAQRSRDREPPVGVDVHLAHAVPDPLLDLLDRDAEGGLELAAGRVDAVDELLRDARGAVHHHVGAGKLAVDLLDQVHRQHLARGLAGELVRAVTRPDRDRERVDPRPLDEVDRLVRVGQVHLPGAVTVLDP